MLWALFQVVVFAPLLLDAKKTHLDIGFVWVRDTSEMGWTWRHNQGRIFMHTRLTEKYPELEVRTHYAKNVDDTVKPPNCPSIYDKWGSAGLDIVFGTSFGHQECLADMVDKYPNTVWFHISGFLQKPEARNWGLGYARIYQPTYLAGIVAARGSQTGKIGAVFPRKLPETQRQLAAFALGVAHANASAEVHVAWTNKWEATEREVWATRQLAAEGCDVLFHRGNSIEAVVVAGELGCSTIGFVVDHRMVAGEHVLISPSFNWGVIYLHVAELVWQGKFAQATPTNLFPGLQEDAVGLTAPSFFVSKDTLAEVAAAGAAMVNGSTDVFCGVIRTNEGTTVGAPRTCASVDNLRSMMWQPHNVIDYGFWPAPSEVCSPGEYPEWHALNKSFSCPACPAGTQSHIYGNSSTIPSHNHVEVFGCEPCRLGEYAPHNSSECLRCSPGSEPTAARDACQLCPADTMSASGDVCIPCDRGLESEAGAMRCTRPPPSALGLFIAIACGSVLLVVVLLAGVLLVCRTGCEGGIIEWMRLSMVRPIESEEMGISSILNDFRFTCPETERDIRNSLASVKTYFIYCAVFLLMHMASFGANTVEFGVGVNLLLLTPPIILVLTSLSTCWISASPYISKVISLTVLVGFVSQMFTMHWQVPVLAEDMWRQMAPGDPFLGADQAMVLQQTASLQLAWPHICITLLLLQVTNGYLYCKCLLFVHLGIPVVFGLAMLSPNVAFMGKPLACVVLGVLCCLWQNIQRTVTCRKRFVAELAVVKAKEKELSSRAMETSEKADSMLNHTLKNAMADAVGLIDEYQQDPSDQSIPLLSQAMARLQTGMRWCKQRLMIIRVTAAQYMPQPKAVDLGRFVGELVQGRNVSVPPFNNNSVLLDGALCTIILENVLNNATKHGCPGNADVWFHVEQTPTIAPRQKLVFKVTNRADPAKPRISGDLLVQAEHGPVQRTSGALFDGFGLQHIVMAAQTLGMATSLTQDGDVVTFEASIDTEIVADPDSSLEARAPFPVGLRICCIDDSAVARRLVALHVSRHFPGSTVQQFGDTLMDVQRFKEAVLSGADVAILDQNMEYPSMTVYGTTLVQELLLDNYRGLLCIRSANSSEADVALYKESGAHCSVDKAARPEEMVEQIKVAYLRHVGPYNEPAGIAQGSETRTSRTSSTVTALDLGASNLGEQPSIPGSVEEWVVEWVH